MIVVSVMPMSVMADETVEPVVYYYYDFEDYSGGSDNNYSRFRRGYSNISLKQETSSTYYWGFRWQPGEYYYTGFGTDGDTAVTQMNGINCKKIYIQIK